MPDLTEWIPVELEIVDRIWKPDTEILKLKGFNALEVLGKLQVRHYQSHILYIIQQSLDLRYHCVLKKPSIGRNSITRGLFFVVKVLGYFKIA